MLALTVIYEEASLPVAPYWKHEEVQNLHAWLEETINLQTSFQQWLASCFPQETFPWIPQIINETWLYTRKCGNLQPQSVGADDLSATLRQTWKMALVVTVLSNQIYIPENAIGDIANKINLHGYSACKAGSARLVNKFVKYLFLQFYKVTIDEVMIGLEGLVRAPGKDEVERQQWGQIFCITILLIVVISRMQEALTDNCLFSKQDGRDIRQETLTDIQDLENVFFALTEIFHSKYKTKNTSRASQHNLFRNSSQIKNEDLQGLVSGISKIKQENEAMIFEHRILRPENIDELKFSHFNMQRLLAAFLAPLFEGPANKRSEDHRSRRPP